MRALKRSLLSATSWIIVSISIRDLFVVSKFCANESGRRQHVQPPTCTTGLPELMVHQLCSNQLYIKSV